MGKPGPKAHSVINDLLKKAKGKSPLKQQKLPMESGIKRNMYKSY